MNEPNLNQPPPTEPTKEKKNTPPNLLHFLIIALLITIVLNFITSTMASKRTYQIEYSQFIQLIESGSVDVVQLEEEQLLLTLNKTADESQLRQILFANTEEAPQMDLWDQIFYTIRVDDPSLVERLDENDVRFYQNNAQTNPILTFMASWIFPVLILYVMYYFLFKNMTKRMGGGTMGGIGKSKAKVFDAQKITGITFADVAGQDEAKESLYEMIDFLHNPEKYEQIGAKQPRGALLVGPPGTGKTLLARAVAGEAKVPFYSITGSEFIEMYVGVGASRVRDLFAEATKNAPCIIFIDEIDAIGKSRDNQMSSNDQREQTLNQLLSEMDGFDTSKGIIVLAATNRPEVLDKALLRPGRFDRRIIVDKPDLPGREAILKVHAAKVKLDKNANLKDVALATSGATGADLANMVNEAALRAVRFSRDVVTQEDLLESVEVVIAGKEKKDRILNPKEKQMVAFHEVGHALATALQRDGMPVTKITIVPRTMGSLGYTMNTPEEERYLLTQSELKAQIITLLSGRAAEQIIFNEVSTGASNDIERATGLARSMVTQYGMSDRFGAMGLESTRSQYLDGRNVLTCSEQTGAAIDEEVRAILMDCEATAFNLLSDNRQALNDISAYLLEKENITGEKFMDLLALTQEAL